MRISTSFTLLFFCAFWSTSSSQTTYVLDPNGDGGFESGFGWAANGWSVANDATNTWNLGTKAPGYTGNRAAFISKNSGSTWEYDITAGTKSYFYRDIAIPNVAYSVYLSFSWIGEGENGWDDLEVYKVNAGSTPTGGSSLYNPKTKLGGPYGESSSWQTVTIDISTYKNSTIGLVFAWKCGTTDGVQPPHAVDNIAIYYVIPLSNEGLLSLDGTYNEQTNANKISWEVNADNNITNFSVERSNDGSIWQEITSVDGSKGLTSYSVLDKNPLYGTAYYRIKQTKSDGFYFYSNPITIKKTVNADFVLEGIYPNPASDRLNLSLFSKEKITIKVIDLLGKTVLTKELNSDVVDYSINTKSFDNGVYILVVSSNNTVQTERITIQH